MYHTIELLGDCSEKVPYTNVNFPAYASRSHLSAYKDMGAASHWHDDFEFGVVLSGRMHYTVNGRQFLVHSGEGIFINSRQLHSNYSVDGSDCEYACVLLHPSLLCAAPHVAEKFITPVISNSAFTHQLLRPDTPWHAALVNVIRRIQQAFAEGSDTLALTVQSLAFEVASLLYANMPEAGPLSARIDRRLSALRNMVGYMQQHYEEKIALSDIAAAGNVSESGCCAIFRQQLRQTPVGYLSRYRVEKGMELLEQPDLSITDVALAVGFSSASYFTETFHKHMGLTPTAYRKRASSY